MRIDYGHFEPSDVKQFQTAGAEFTGKAPGFTCQVVIRWYANGTQVQDGQQISGNLALQTMMTS